MTAVEALYRALFARISEPSTGNWGGRAYADVAPTGAEMPFVVFSMNAGGERNRLIQRDAELVVTVKAVGKKLTDVFISARTLHELLNDMGVQDVPLQDALNAGDEWVVTTTTVEGYIHTTELVDAQLVYQHGFFLRVVMQLKEGV